jgi:hypothetical protein
MISMSAARSLIPYSLSDSEFPPFIPDSFLAVRIACLRTTGAGKSYSMVACGANEGIVPIS